MAQGREQRLHIDVLSDDDDGSSRETVRTAGRFTENETQSDTDEFTQKPFRQCAGQVVGER